jgi:cellulose synthase/poly-beta-1,6-N-acetylglucosamine synthase-like glycosyltransferase
LIDLYICVSFLLTGLYVLVLIYLIRGWVAIKRPVLSQEPFKTKVTILIAARDEADNMAETIDDLLAQDYPHELTEIIIVDDHSTDNTASIILSYANRGVKLLQLKEDQALNSYKKKAISEAIARSTGDLLVATDADCRMDSQWLSTVVSYYETYNPVMISSPVTYFHEQSFFERLQTLEFSFLIGIGAAFIGNGRASTCNGANLAYRKDVFYEVGGFKGIDDLASGDDELLLQKVAVKYPGRIAFLKNDKAIVYTYAKPTLHAFIQQRRRWASKSTRYKDKKVVALAVGMWLFNISLLVNFIGGFFYNGLFKVLLVELLFKLLFESVLLLMITSFFKRKSLVKLILILSPIHIFYVVYVGLMGNTRKYAWKGRLVR